MSQLYEQSYFAGRVGDPKRERMYRQEFDRVLEKTGLDGGSVLDVGCGLGDFLDLFPDERWKKYGVEVSQHAIEACQAKGISFDLPDQAGAFDLVILRGSLQHLDRPVDTLFRCHDWLRVDGWLCILATPNAGGIVYRLFQDLPALNDPLNFVVFSDKALRNCLRNIGFQDMSFEYPYADTAYASVLNDHLLFALRFLRIKKRFAFWRNMMECYARRPAGPVLR